MIKLIILAGILFLFFMPGFRCLIFNLHNVALYSVYDTVMYFVEKRYKRFVYYGIDMFVGMFGKGKSLSMTHYARRIYERYGNNVRFISNYRLYDIPYVPLVNFNQLLELGEDEDPYYTKEELEDHVPPAWYYDNKGKILSKYIEEIPCRVRYKVFEPIANEYIYLDSDEVDDFEGLTPEYIPLDPEDKIDSVFLEKYPDEVSYLQKVKRWIPIGNVVLIDEIEDVLSHRNFSSFPLELLNVLTQQRKKHVYILCSAQRFFMVDKIFRSITTHVIDCNKIWRFQRQAFYDAWEYENGMNVQLLRPSFIDWWFVKNKDFNSYDTEQMVSRTMSEDFISNDERLARLGVDNVVNEKAIRRPSKFLRRLRKGSGGR